MSKKNKGGRPATYHREALTDGEWHYIEHFANKNSWVSSSRSWATRRGMDLQIDRLRAQEEGKCGLYVRFVKQFVEIPRKDPGLCPDCVESGQIGPPKRPALKYCDAHTRARFFAKYKKGS